MYRWGERRVDSDGATKCRSGSLGRRGEPDRGTEMQIPIAQPIPHLSVIRVRLGGAFGGAHQQ